MKLHGDQGPQSLDILNVNIKKLLKIDFWSLYPLANTFLSFSRKLWWYLTSWLPLFRSATCSPTHDLHRLLWQASHTNSTCLSHLQRGTGRSYPSESSEESPMSPQSTQSTQINPILNKCRKIHKCPFCLFNIKCFQRFTVKRLGIYMETKNIRLIVYKRDWTHC